MGVACSTGECRFSRGKAACASTSSCATSHVETLTMRSLTLGSPAALALAAALAACTPSADSSEPTGPGTGGDVPPGVSFKADGPGIDRSRFQPALFPGLDWGCRWASDQRQIFCNANALAFEVLDPFTPVTDCADGGTVYAKNSRNLIAKRYYDSDYRLVQRVLHWYENSQILSRHPDGSGPTASGSENFFETNDYSIPGNMDDGVTTTLQGTEAEIRLDALGHELLVLDKGELRIDPSGAFTILSGRWDFFTDGDAANARICAALQ